MSGEGPESVPTSADPRSHRPLKKRALTPVSAQAASVTALFSHPDAEIRIPASGSLVSKSKSRTALPPEIVTNVQGSSAGAGSGEFHVYKASRRREYERLRQMDDEVRQERESSEFDRAKEERERKDEEKRRKNREKRDKNKARKAKHKGGQGNGKDATNGGGGPTTGVKAPRAVAIRRQDGDDHDGGAGDAEVKDAPPAAAEEPRGIVIEED
jgi:hypothetical protein